MNAAGPVHIASLSELAVQLNAIGSVRRLDHRNVIVNAYLGNEVEGGPANLFLRRRGSPIAWAPLFGQRSPERVALDETGLEIAGMS